MHLYKIIAFSHYDATASSEDGVHQGKPPKKRYRKTRRLPANNVLESTSSKLCITGLSSDHPKNYSIIKYPDKGVFEGITRHGTSRRVGTMQYPNGDYYTGIFKRSKKTSKNSQSPVPFP